MKFAKPALTVEQQIALLESRGMAVPDHARAAHYLTHVNYYRLRAYWLPFETAVPADGGHAFAPGTTFETVLGIYVFDRGLRLLLLDAIERVEISLRTTLTHTLSLRYGPFAHERAELFEKQDAWLKSRDELAKEYERSRETFAQHYRHQYQELESPPLWVACELMSFGHLSRWLHNLKRPADRQAVADVYGLDERVLVSFAHHLSVVRNHCAHHSRVWNRRFALRFTLPTKKPRNIASAFNPGEPQLLYNTLTMLIYLLDQMSPAHGWRQRLLALVDEHPEIDPARMGCPTHWREVELWKGAE